MTDSLGTGDPPTSYAEKYRGTEWGRPEPPPPPPRPRGPRGAAIVAVVAVVVAVAIGIGALALSRGVPVANLRAAPSQGAAGGAGALARPAASPTPSPTPDPGNAVMDRFWAVVSATDLSYHMTARGTSRFDRQKKVSVTESVDVVGDDFAGTYKIPAGTARIARKDGVVWAKGNGPRFGFQLSTRTLRLTPFLCIQMPAWLDYVKSVTVNGRHLHLLRSNRFYRPDIPRMALIRQFPYEPDKMTLDLLVTDAGVPVSATFAVDLTGTDSAGQHTFHARADYTFSKVGAKLRIVVPKR
jgi:hypothetical protein